MVTLRLNIKDKALNKVMQSLKAFTADEVMIINEDQQFLADQNSLQKELDEVNSGKAQLVSHDELENSLNEVIEKHENRL